MAVTESEGREDKRQAMASYKHKTLHYVICKLKRLGKQKIGFTRRGLPILFLYSTNPTHSRSLKTKDPVSSPLLFCLLCEYLSTSKKSFSTPILRESRCQIQSPPFSFHSKQGQPCLCASIEPSHQHTALRTKLL